MGDRKYTETGNRGEDPRHGFGDDMGTRVGRPDGAREAPRDANPGQQPGQPGTNDEAVADGLEGSIMEGEGRGQRDVRDATRADASRADASRGDVNPDPESGDEREIYDL
ncbi:hypothetical protein J421_1594 [Gemmatirosa kalamazoonensis]|uniref:Uncharacterized protein n=1 Tax=Gemmatirosa kalamazoonensis TaxID=861299 RepID=W0RE89_9BACT|nr:hypothetical protein [Gemmatirosa kalamazoonensis]AHG89131.1 hypothetical protein J421_1594 [Gemmatirosa kalamazoonensis]